MVLDLAIVALAIAAVYRGKQIGFSRQFFSMLGFFVGLLFGAWLQPHISSHAGTQNAKSATALAVTLGCAMLLFIAGEYLGLRLKSRLAHRKIDKVDGLLGSLFGFVSILFSIWLLGALLGSLPYPGLQNTLDQSRILSRLNESFPNAPTVVADLGHLVDPNGFPQVFTGREPTPPSNIATAQLGEFANAVRADRSSVVKLEGQGCGGIVDGSGFVVGQDLVATNAHVVAGIRHPYVKDLAGTHKAAVIWFDPNLDFAVLRVSNLAGKPLVLASSTATIGTPAVVMGYPGGGELNAGSAAVLNTFTATGKNIYGRSTVTRKVYELRGTVIPGNSGGPLIAKDGSVLGVIFAQSTRHETIGYALTNEKVAPSIQQASIRTSPVSTGPCTE